MSSCSFTLRSANSFSTCRQLRYQPQDLTFSAVKLQIAMPSK
jgi:hypothetical protein